MACFLGLTLAWLGFVAAGELRRLQSGPDELEMYHFMRIDLAMRESAFAEDGGWRPHPEVVGYWPANSLSQKLLEDVHTAILSFSANMQGVLSGDFSSFYSLAWRNISRNFPVLKRYMGGNLAGANQEHQAHHFYRLQQKYSRSIRRVMHCLENVTDGSRLMREATLKLLEAGQEAWGAEGPFLEAQLQ